MRAPLFLSTAIALFVLSASESVVADRVVLFVLDGAGDGAVSHGGLPSSSGRWVRGSVSTPAGGSSAVVSALATGCDVDADGSSLSMTGDGVPADKISQRFGRSGYGFCLLTTKCVDDGTSAGFLVSVADRYDEESVGRAVTLVDPPPTLATGGFSRNLWRAASEASAGFVEFESRGGSAFAETCEYPRGESLGRRATLALDRLDEESDRWVFVAVSTGVDAAAHSGDSERLSRELREVREALETVERRLERGGGSWKMLVVGSHDTGEPSSNGTLSHGAHAPPGKKVPLFARGALESDVRAVRTMSDVSRLLSRKMRCTRERSHVYANGRRRRRRRRGLPEDHSPGWLLFFLIFLPLCSLAFCFC